MNIEKFDENIRDIRSKIAHIDVELENRKTFSSSVRFKLNTYLENLLTLLRQDSTYMKLPNKTRHLAYRVVQFQKLHVKLKKMRKKILTSFDPPFFTTKIQNIILPPLEKRIKEVTRYLGSIERFPFDQGNDRSLFLLKVKEQLELKNPKEIIYAEKEYFHFLGNSLDSRELKQINTQPYNGNLEIYSLESWSTVIIEFISLATTQEEKRMGSTLLIMLQKAEPIALKLSYAYTRPQMKKIGDMAQEKEYFKDYIEFYKEKELPPPTVQKEATNNFFQKYTLKDDCPIPANIFINEIAWDMYESIQEMKPGQARIFPAGSHTHSIIVEVLCLLQFSYFYPKGKYRYKIFNTGNGVTKFHSTKTINGELRARPIVIDYLTKTAFSYSFLSELARLALQEFTDVEEFYELHHQVLVRQAGGREDLDSGSWHQIQKEDRGICTYTAVEAWIDSYLTIDQINFLELIKAQLSTDKQKKVVNILEKEVQASNKHINGKRKQEDDEAMMKKNRKLENSRALLKLGEQHFSKALKSSFN